MLSHLQAHRRRREHERQLAEQARRAAAYPLIIRASRDPDSLSDSEWDELSAVIDSINSDHEWLTEKLRRAAMCEAAIAVVPELLPRKRKALLQPHSIGAHEATEEWCEVVSRHSELESISMSLPMLVPRPSPLPDPLAV